MPVIFYAGFLFYLSSLSIPRVPHFVFADKMGHLILYAGFGIVFVRAFQPFRRCWSSFLIILVATSGALLYGISDEVHQYFVPLRSPEWGDLLSDSLGGLLGGLFFSGFQYVQKSGSKANSY